MSTPIPIPTRHPHVQIWTGDPEIGRALTLLVGAWMKADPKCPFHTISWMTARPSGFALAHTDVVVIHVPTLKSEVRQFVENLQQDGHCQCVLIEPEPIWFAQFERDLPPGDTRVSSCKQDDTEDLIRALNECVNGYSGTALGP